MITVSELKKRLLPDARAYTQRILIEPSVKTALDVGCGASSYLSEFRPKIRTVGLDAFAGSIETARQHNVHDDYITANILEVPVAEILARNGGNRFDLVTLFDVLEHVPKRTGFELLEKCEQLTSAYVLLQTPHGFVPQGPEFGNIYQRHLSGWFPEDLQGLGYTVAGCAGTKALIGYGGRFRWNLPGIKVIDFVLGMILNLERHPKFALNFAAWKDVRGVPPRL